MNNPFKNKRVLVFGLGLNQGGVGSAKFFSKQGANVRVTDLKNSQTLKQSLDELNQYKDIEYTLGGHKYDDIDWADLIIKNPAVKPGNPYIEYALKYGKQVEMDLGIFLQFVKSSQIIGVTGTKGKSTTASLIYQVLKTGGRNVILAGNIGKSILDSTPVKPDTLVVLEISSFQLEAFDQHKTSPKWGIITNITPDHLNYYQTMDEYITAKKIIGKYQTKDDFLFIRKDDPITSKPDFISSFKGKIIYFSKDDLPKDFKPRLKGEHNLENLAAAYQVGKIFNINSTLSLKTLTSFNGIPFRMELVKEWRGFKIYNDSTATNPSATIQALKTLGPKTQNQEQNIILIVGGMNKNMDYKELAYTIDLNAKAVYFLEGGVVDNIICEMHEKVIIEGRFDNLEKLLSKLKNDITTNPYFKKGDSILFSPAATSFNLFQNEFDRGRKFNTALEKVFTD